MTGQVMWTWDSASCSAEGIFLSASCAASLSCKVFTSQINKHKITSIVKKTILHGFFNHLKGFHSIPKWWQVSKQFLHRKLWRLCVFKKRMLQQFLCSWPLCVIFHQAHRHHFFKSLVTTGNLPIRILFYKWKYIKNI